MSDPVRVDKASLDALVADKASAERERDYWKARALKDEAIIAHYGTSLNEQHNDPASDGKPEAPNA